MSTRAMTGSTLLSSSQPNTSSNSPNGDYPGPAGPSTVPYVDPVVSATAPCTDPWRPIVLSLDGGGIRGLSSLYIIREIMKEIKKLENPDSNDVGDLPLPCHYFDFMVGTSTGGLIAVMLGRLRMGIENCIQEYHVFGDSIFRPRKANLLRFITSKWFDRFRYSPVKFNKAVEAVVSKYCGCNSQERSSCRDHHLRQYDYAEEWDNTHQSQFNATCKVAVVTLREGGGNSDSVRSGDVPYLFRTYNHQKRQLFVRATSAAPTWFPHVKLRGRKFIDGGVTDYNNPVSLAWREARQMAHKPSDQEDQTTAKGPCVLLSIGTGKSKSPPMFGLYNILLSAKHKLTDTEEPHQTTQGWIGGYGCSYRRFNVPVSNARSQREGLDTVRLDSCDRERREPFWKRSSQKGSEDADSQSSHETVAYNPRKYRYKTYEKIHDRTIKYCQTTSLVDEQSPASNNIVQQIKECARELFDLSQQRKEKNLDRWNKFREHPDPRSRGSPQPTSQGQIDLATPMPSQPNA